jgi:hypothetical protein
MPEAGTAYCAGLLCRRMRLFEMVDLADMLGGMGELEAYALAMPHPPEP